MRPLRILGKSISNAIKSVFRNFSLSIASISCIIITLIIVSFAIILSYNVNNFTNDIESDLTIVTFVKKDATDEEIETIQNDLKALPNIDNIQYKSKEDIKNEMMQENDSYKKVMSEWTTDSNPLKPCFIVTVKNAENMGETANTIKNMKNVDSVNYGEGMVEDLLSVFDVVRKVMIVAVVALIFVTAFLIGNTIKITIYSRRNEIDIMRLVGTSNTVIKLPFLFEGLFLGIIGSIIPVLVTIYGYVLLYDKLGGKVFTDIFTLVKPMPFVLHVSLALVVIGGVVGMLGSSNAVRKYLKI